jgi:predicted GIY-YIG superfamily endonuclease
LKLLLAILGLHSLLLRRIVRCRPTRDVTTRVTVQNACSGPHFTAARRPVVLAYQESFDTAEQARQLEIQLKKTQEMVSRKEISPH